VLSRNNLDWKDSSGIVNGATVFSYADPFWTFDNWQTVSATLVGPWSTKNTILGPVPNITAAWTPNESDDTYYTGQWDVTLGSLAIDPSGGVFGSPDSPQTKTITYNVTDNGDGAKASGSYIYHVHDPTDNLRPNPDACYAPTSTEVFYAHPPMQGYYCVGNLNGSPTNATSSVAIAAQVQGKLALAGEMTLPILKVLKPSLEFQLQLTQTVTVSTQVSQIPSGMEEFPEAIVTWPTFHDIDDEWSSAGFIGTFPQEYDDLSKAVTTLTWSKPVPIGTTDLPDGPIGN